MGSTARSPAVQILAERWTPLIIRNLHLGCETFGEILEGAPGLSHTLLAQRLHQLERLGIVEMTPKAQGRGHRYLLTTSGDDLFKVCETLGEWGARWLEIAPEDLDPFVALWSMGNALRPSGMCRWTTRVAPDLSRRRTSAST